MGPPDFLADSAAGSTIPAESASRFFNDEIIRLADIVNLLIGKQQGSNLVCEASENLNVICRVIGLEFRI
jgi:hypothetical protein